MSERWGYAINQWKPNFDYFTRRLQHERAFKTLSAAGFDAIELRAGTGRWEPLGRPRRIDDNFGSAAGLVEFLAGCGIERIASYFWDPGEANVEEPAPSRSPLEPSDHAGIVASAGIFARFLSEVGGSCLVVRAVPGVWRTGALSAEELDCVGACWNAVAEMTTELGVTLALHVDFLSPLRTPRDIEALLDRTEAGLALDTAELAIAGIDPVQVAERLGERVSHVHLKDARDVVGDDALTPNAEKHVLLAGGPRGIERWFWELGEGTIDVAGTVAALRARGYDGWWIVESDQSPAPPESAMLNAWVVRNVLAADAGQSPNRR